MIHAIIRIHCIITDSMLIWSLDPMPRNRVARFMCIIGSETWNGQNTAFALRTMREECADVQPAFVCVPKKMKPDRIRHGCRYRHYTFNRMSVSTLQVWKSHVNAFAGLFGSITHHRLGIVMKNKEKRRRRETDYKLLVFGLSHWFISREWTAPWAFWLWQNADIPTE